MRKPRFYELLVVVFAMLTLFLAACGGSAPQTTVQTTPQTNQNNGGNSSANPTTAPDANSFLNQLNSVGAPCSNLTSYPVQSGDGNTYSYVAGYIPVGQSLIIYVKGSDSAQVGALFQVTSDPNSKKAPTAFIADKQNKSIKPEALGDYYPGPKAIVQIRQSVDASFLWMYRGSNQGFGCRIVSNKDINGSLGTMAKAILPADSYHEYTDTTEYTTASDNRIK